MNTYADEVIDTWADLYQACRLEQTGLSFEEFLACPEQHLDRLGMSDAEEIIRTGFLPLLPEQARVRMALARQPAPASPAARQQAVQSTMRLSAWQSGMHEPLHLG